MLTFTGEIVFYYTVDIFLFTIGFKMLFTKIKEIRNVEQEKNINKKRNKKSKLPLGFCISISNIISLILCNILI